jgi:hypothetical protein
MKISGAILGGSLPALAGFRPVPPGGGRALDAAAAAWAGRPPDATHHLVVRGGSRVSRGLLRRARLAAARFPDAAVSFFAGWNEPNGSAVRLAAASRCAWAEGIQFASVSTPAVLLPARHAAGFADFAAAVGGSQPDHDSAFLDYLQLTGVPLYLSVPSLVDTGDRAAWFGADDPAPDGPVLAGYPLCPYLFRGLGYGMNRYGEPPAHTWCHENWTVLARRAGLRPEAVLAGLTAGAPTFTTGLWATAFLVGYLAHGHVAGRTTVAVPGPASPLLGTLIAGGRHGSVLPGAGPEQDAALRAVAHAAYRAGVRTAAAPHPIEVP